MRYAVRTIARASSSQYVASSEQHAARPPQLCLIGIMHLWPHQKRTLAATDAAPPSPYNSNVPSTRHAALPVPPSLRAARHVPSATNPAHLSAPCTS